MIEVNNLSKHFGRKKAVDGITFSVEKGQVLGFLGPNGAGKSTTMRMVTGFFPPSAGSISIGGIDILSDPIEAKRRIGYLPENAPLYTDMTVSAFLRFMAEMRGLRGSLKRKAVDRVLEMCFLQRVRNQSIDTLSKGYRHRTCFAQSILHDPEVLILDEPTDGLDPNQKHEVRSLIKRMGEKKAIIFSTHILEEVEAVCGRAVIIDRGKIVADGSPDELKGRADNAGHLEIRVSGGGAADIRAALAKLEHVKEVKPAEEGSGDKGFAGAVVPAATDKADKVAAAIGTLCVAHKWTLTGMRKLEGRLDDVFRSITRSDT